MSRSPCGVCLRTIQKPVAGIPGFDHDYAIDLAVTAPLDVGIFVNNGLVEFSAGGALWLTNLFFPTDTAGPSAWR